MRRRMGDVLLSVGALAILLVALVSVDDRVREQVTQLLNAGPSTELVAVESQVRELTSVVFQAVHDQSIEHAPMMIFGAAATILVLFMLRT